LIHHLAKKFFDEDLKRVIQVDDSSLAKERNKEELTIQIGRTFAIVPANLSFLSMVEDDRKEQRCDHSD
jgi:hypothetical protein